MLYQFQNYFVFPSLGSCSALDVANNILILNVIDQTQQFHLITLNLDTLQTNEFTSTKYYAQAMVGMPHKFSNCIFKPNSSEEFGLKMQFENLCGIQL